MTFQGGYNRIGIRKGCIMKNLVTFCTAVSLALGIACATACRYFPGGAFYALAITFFTTFYHFAMRVTVAIAVTLARRNGTVKDIVPFSLGNRERRLYGRIKVKLWKDCVPTYNKAQFTVKRGNSRELMHNMINAELGHEIMVFLSFAPLLLSEKLDGFVPFLVTSVCAALFDMQFVIIQRYNRDRLSCIMQRELTKKLRKNKYLLILRE